MKYVLVTGAYGGMGKAVTSMLVENGFAVFALDKSVEQPANNVIPIEADLTSVESISSAYDKISTYTTELYAIVHLAGIYMLHSSRSARKNTKEYLMSTSTVPLT